MDMMLMDMTGLASASSRFFGRRHCILGASSGFAAWISRAHGWWDKRSILFLHF